MKKQDRPARKKRPVYAYPFKIKLVEEIENGYLSLRYASIKYHVSRSTLDDWRERYGKHHRRMKDKNLSPEKKIKKQQQRIEDLELMLDLQRGHQVLSDRVPIDSGTVQPSLAGQFFDRAAHHAPVAPAKPGVVRN